MVAQAIVERSRISQRERDITSRAVSSASVSRATPPHPVATGRKRHLAHEGICGICREHRSTLRYRAPAKVDACDGCYRRRLQPRHACGSCGETAIATCWVDRQAYCPRCYKKRVLVERCGSCQRRRPVLARRAGQALCRVCACVREACVTCGRIAEVAKRLGRGALCSACWRKDHAPRVACSRCRKRRVVARREGRRVWCQACYEREKRPLALCSSCGVTAPVKARRSDRILCARCYERARSSSTTRAGFLEADTSSERKPASGSQL